MTSANEGAGAGDLEYRRLDALATRIRIHRTYSEKPDDVEQAVVDVLSPKCSQLLDVGSGTASFLARLANSGRAMRLYALDTSPAAVAEAAAIAGVVARAGDACANPFESASFDGVTARHMLYHVPDLNQALLECRRVLRPGGQLIAVVNRPDTTPRVVQLVKEAVAELGIHAPPAPASLVHSDNLPAEIERVFGEVAVIRHDNALVFTSPRPLADYAVALLAFYGVPPDSPSYEVAASSIVSKARAWFRNNDTPWRDPKGYSVTVGIDR